MKNSIILLCIVCFLLSSTILAQKDTIWYDSNWKVADKKSADYYRPKVKKKGNLYLQVDYYLSGAKQMEAYAHSETDPDYEGEVKWYFENGKLFQLVHYKNGILDGNRKIYYESGQLKTNSNYKNGKLNGKWESYYSNGKMEAQGKYEDNQREGNWKTYYDDGKLESEGKYVFDKKVEVWKTNYYDGTSDNEKDN